MPDSDDLSGTVLDGRYQVIEPIAEGAMGSVYRGERLKLGRAVAIKIMHQELPDELASRQRFEREAKLMALLEHPNCVSVSDFGVHDDKPFLVMDLVRGTSLIDVLDKQGRVDVARGSDIIRQVLSGLAHAHELGIVHRDIKPANIMISEKAGLGSQVRILDFGLARLTEGSTKLTTGIVVGTPNYMAPEQCKGGDIDARTDLYAVGVMFFEMLTGRKPFVADEPLQVVRKHLLEQPPTLAMVDPSIDWGDLEGIVAKALSKAPSDRFDSAVDMAKAIEAAAAKHTKASVAALYARAVPEGVGPAGSQLATMSGWSVPASPMSPTTAGTSDSLAVPTTANATEAADSTSVTERSSPTTVTGQTSAPAPLPPLPSAGPYVPPPGIGTPGPAAFGTHATAPAPNAGDAAPPGTTAQQPTAARVDSVMSGPAVDSAPHLSTPAVRRADHPIPQLPFTKKQLIIGAGGLFAVIVLIALVAGGDSSKTKDKASAGGGAKGSGSAAVVVPDPEPAVDPVPTIIEKATALMGREDYDAAASLLKRARKQHPGSAEIAFLAGKAYFNQLWWSDGVDSFRDAIRLDPSYKENPELLKLVLKGFLTTPDVDNRIVGFMRNDIGLPMRTYLEETAAKHPKKALRMRATAELNAGR